MKGITFILHNYKRCRSKYYLGLSSFIYNSVFSFKTNFNILLKRFSKASISRFRTGVLFRNVY